MFVKPWKRVPNEIRPHPVAAFPSGRGIDRLTIMRRILIIALAVLVLAAGFVLWFVRDADRFKPALVTQLERATGIEVEVRGDLAWRFMPDLWLTAAGLHAIHEGRAWSVERLAVRPDVFSLIRNPGTPDRWRVDEAVVRDLGLEDERGLIRAPRLIVRNIGLGNPASVAARIVYTPENRQPVEVAVAGTLTVETDRFSARDLSFRMPAAAGRCDLQAMPNGKLWPPLEPVENSILPIGIMRAYDWDGRCGIERIEHQGETIENAVIVLDNKEGGSILSVDAPDFLGGRAQLEVVLRADGPTVAWDLRPVLHGVDSRRLAAWLGGGSLIAAPVDYGGIVRMEGNTPKALAASIDANTSLSAGPGEIDGSAFVAPLAEVSALLDSGNSAMAVPAKLHYESLSGAWIVDGERHRLDLALDSLRLEANGDYLVAEDKLDLRGVIDPGDSIEQWGLRFPPALAGAPFHFRCRGSAADPRCRLDAKRTLLGAGAAEGGAVARELIDVHVPEEYRDAARSLLDSLETQVDAALRKDPEELIGEQVPERYRGMARSLLEKLGETLDEEN